MGQRCEDEIKTDACIVVLGGSFDPVHCGHIALATYFVRLLGADVLRIIPAANPWQKNGLIGTAQQRCKMLELAFQQELDCSVQIDQQEILRAEQGQTTYSIDTLRNLRTEYGKQASLVFLIGADQLLNLSSWHQWQQLFDLAHICAASRPGFQLNQMLTSSPATNDVMKKFTQGAARPEQIRSTPAGFCYLAEDLSIDISATQIRRNLEHGTRTPQLIPTKVLDYIQQHHLYEKK